MAKKEISPIKKGKINALIDKKENELVSYKEKYSAVFGWSELKSNGPQYNISFNNSVVSTKIMIVRNAKQDSLLQILESKNPSQKAEVLFILDSSYKKYFRINWGYENDQLKGLEFYCKIISIKILD